MKTIKEQLPLKNKPIKLHFGKEKIECIAFEGGSGVYSIETEDFDDNRYWCEGDETPGCSLEDIKDCKWEYVNK